MKRFVALNDDENNTDWVTEHSRGTGHQKPYYIILLFCKFQTLCRCWSHFKVHLPLSNGEESKACSSALAKNSWGEPMACLSIVARANLGYAMPTSSGDTYLGAFAWYLPRIFTNPLTGSLLTLTSAKVLSISCTSHTWVWIPISRVADVTRHRLRPTSRYPAELDALYLQTPRPPPPLWSCALSRYYSAVNLFLFASSHS